MKIGASLSHSQISSYLPKEDSWNNYFLFKKPDKGIKNLKENEYKLYKVLTLDGILKNVRFSIWSSYIIENGNINKERLNEYKSFFETLKNHSIDLMGVLNHFTHPKSFGDLFSKDFSKNVINYIDGINVLFDYTDKIMPINEPSNSIFFESLYIKNTPKFFIKLKTAIENIINIHNYVWDNYHKEKEIVNNIYIIKAKDLLYPLNLLFNYFKPLEDLPSHTIGLNYYGTYKLTGRNQNFLNSIFYFPYRLDIKDLSEYIQYYSKKGKRMYITEIGMSANNKKEEDIRFNYIKKAIEISRNIIDILYIWSIIDNFEWFHGYGKKFGICYDINFNKKDYCDEYIKLFNEYK